jgi:hypothetical protein
MGEIPNDIRTSAQKVAQQFLDTTPLGIMAHVIAEALAAERIYATAAERDRCAKIAEGGEQDDGTFIYTVEGEAIAAAIRRGPNPDG